MIKVTLRALGNIYDITKYVDQQIAQTETLVGEFDNAIIEIPIIKADALRGIDLSRRIPRLAIVEIEDLQKAVQYYVTVPEVTNLGNGYYKHRLELSDLSYITKLRALPDYSVTQPTGEAGLFINEISKGVPTPGVVGEQVRFIHGAYLDAEVPFQIASLSLDTDYIENREIKEAGTYHVNMTLGLKRPADLQITTYDYKDFKVIILSDNIVVKEVPFGDLKWKNSAEIKTLNVGETLDLGLGEIKIKLYAETDRYYDSSIYLFVSPLSLEIVYNEELSGEEEFLDEVVEKLFKRVNVIDEPEFLLDQSTKGRLATIKAFDDMNTDITLYDALKRIADYVKAKINVTLNEGYKIVSFLFYDDLAKAEFVDFESNENAMAQVDDYVSAFELKNNNVLKENYITEVVSIRTDGVSQITTENATLMLSLGIDRLFSVEVKGKEVRNTGNDIILSDDVWFDITDKIVEKAYYETLDGLADYETRSKLTKNNHLWFVRGVNIIGGLGYIGDQFETFLPQEMVRAVYEVIASKLYIEGLNPKKFIDGGLSDDINLMFKVKYYPMSESSAYIYKEDQSGFEEKVTRKLNANDRVNNVDILGDYARTKVNAVGGTRISKDNIATVPEDIPLLGTHKNNNYVITVTKYSSIGQVTFITTMMKDFIAQSEYIGIDSDRKLYRVPKDEYVDRVDKALSVIELSKRPIGGNNTPFTLERVLRVLSNSQYIYAPQIAHVTVDERNITLNVDKNAIGNAIEWRIGMLDNYVAGYYKTTHSISGKTIHIQRGKEYCDLFGKAKNIKVEYYRERDGWVASDVNAYPNGLLPALGKLATVQYEVNKDTRERYLLALQLGIISSHNEVIVYNGLTKYNKLISDELFNIRLVKLNYDVSMGDKYVDIARSDEVLNDSDVTYNYFTFNVISEGDYAFYEEESKELLLVVKNAVSGVNRIYFKGAIERFKRKDEFEVEAEGDMSVKVAPLLTFKTKKKFKQELNTKVKINVDLEWRVIK